ncbi:MAG: hypothetical protein MZV63_31070 [Marinilabiliales bacterium]|nr:hypothetical protein [Marinilabiliales bacterium]
MIIPEHITGADFTTRLLDDLGVNYLVGNAERLEMLCRTDRSSLCQTILTAASTGSMSIDLLAQDCALITDSWSTRSLSKVKTLDG